LLRGTDGEIFTGHNLQVAYKTNTGDYKREWEKKKKTICVRKEKAWP
jgi:hypothetical protein